MFTGTARSLAVLSSERGAAAHSVPPQGVALGVAFFPPNSHPRKKINEK